VILAANPIDYRNGSRVGNVDALGAGADDRAILSVQSIIFVWALAIPDEEEAPELCVARPRWTGDFREG
jgi:hypothetical protein